MPAPNVTQQSSVPADNPPNPAPANPPAVVAPPPGTATTNPAAQAQKPADGDIVVTGRADDPEDPMQDLNVKSFAVVQSVDEAVTGPAAMTYKKTVPGPVRSGIRNFLSNLQEPIVFLNFLLQLKPGKAAETVGRFAVNSTVGVAGLFDAAKKKPFNLPRRANGFGYTLGYYGVKPGAFLYLPLMGPTTVRDLAGRIVDLSVLPFAVGKPFNDPLYAIPTTTVRLLDERAEANEQVKVIRASDDPYSMVKENYLQQRQNEIDALHGRGPLAEHPKVPELQPEAVQLQP